ncbi:MAG: hypothetical protein MJ177_08415 [Clostridia bacterium]|nr:hypothetical protein [Clostridia bacterium]
MSAKMKNCKVCNAEIASNAKTCPSCGAKNKKPIYKKPWIYIIAAVIVVIVIAVSGGEKPVEIDYSNPEIVVAADDILSEYLANSVNADEKYKDKVVEVSGKVGAINEAYFNIDGDDDDNMFYSVAVYYAADQGDTIRQLKKDSKVTVVGLCKSTDVFSDVKLEEAKIIAEKSNLTQTTAAAQSSGSDNGSNTEAQQKENAQPETVEVDIDTLLQDYENNSVAADDKYKGKNLIITGGAINDISDKYVRIEGYDDMIWMWVNAYFSSKEQISSLKNGDNITVKGICRGDDFGDIKITDATFE